MSRLALLSLALVALAGCDPDLPEAGPFAALQPGVAEGRRGTARLLAGREEGRARADTVQALTADGPDAMDAATEAALAREIEAIQTPFTEAMDAYIAGLAGDDVSRSIQGSLWHGVGLARTSLFAFAEADSAFAEAVSHADDPGRRARYAFDAGTAALVGEDYERALVWLRRSLILNPDNRYARRNYEIARRLLGEDPETPQPSDFARRLKAQADSLVDARQYRAALDVMEGGLAQDSTVASYADYINRLGGIVQIEETVPAGPR